MTLTTRIEKLILYPSSYFNSADEVLNNQDLTRQQKIRILKSWAFEEDRILASEAENLTTTDETDKDHGDTLKHLKQAIRELTMH